MKLPKKSGGGGANWMDTYGDMVTLLLCFFVMLYSMSNVDQNKWLALVGSLNPYEVTTNQPGGNNPGTPPDGALVSQFPVTNADIEAAMNQLYNTMQSYVQQANLGTQVSIGQGNGYVFVSFDDTVFFNGDSYDLRPEGREILDQIAVALDEASDSIDEIRVLGHTAQSRPNQENNVTADRFLASNRATVVTVYLQEKNIIDPAKLVSVGYGQWRPVSSNETPETRARNRRVELIVTGLDVENEANDSITQYYTMRESADGTAGTDTNAPS